MSLTLSDFREIEPTLLHNRLGQFVSKFEIEKYTVCGKLILPKKWKEIFFGTTGMRICMDLRIFASFLYQTLF